MKTQYKIIFVLLLFFGLSYSHAEGHGHPMPWQTLDIKKFICDVTPSSGTTATLNLETSLYQRKSNPKEKHIIWKFNEHIGNNGVNNLREEFISNLVKKNTDLSIYHSKYLTGTETELELAGKDGRLKTEVITDVSSDLELKALPNMQNQIKLGIHPKNWLHHEYFLIQWPGKGEVRNVDSLNMISLEVTPGSTVEEFNLQIVAKTRGDMTAMLTYDYLYKSADVLRSDDTSLAFRGSCIPR